MPKTVDYYFSLNSPWTYMGHARFVAMCADRGVAVRAWPTDFGGVVFPATGGLPVPKRPKERQAYRLVELRRWSEFLGVELNLHPAHWPADERFAVGLVLAVRESGGDPLPLAGAYMRAVWAEERDIAARTTAIAIAGSLGHDGEALAARAERDDLLALRARESCGAIERGVFGAPSYVLDGEVFWGQDRLDFLERALDR